MKLGCVGSAAEAEVLQRLLGGDALVLWQATSLDEVRVQLRGCPVDALLAFTGALQGATRGLRGLGIPVIVIHSGFPSDAAVAYAAMGEGALRVLSLPPSGDETQRLALLRTLHLTLLPSSPSQVSSTSAVPLPPPTPCGYPWIAVGASAGGPPALAEFLRTMGPVPAAILLVQHIDPTFTGDMASWLSAESSIPVDLSSHTLLPRHGRAILASTDEHLVAKAGGQLDHVPAAPHEIHHSSIDKLFSALLPTLGLGWRYYLPEWVVTVLLACWPCVGLAGARLCRMLPPQPWMVCLGQPES
ncbi:MAG: chemotaxis protein CheB [Myxococcales bacterium]|nr:hypothetical protein [Polyangiaceae bacterium]MDW8251457.1 chemotaxis protein CheB [Myxococcales bacterium]